MVYEELISHQVLPYIEAFQQATAAIDKLNKRNQWGRALRRPPNHIEQARSYWRSQYEELFQILETSGETARQALSREANCQKPAKVDPENKGGARAAAIWLSVVDFLKANPKESVFFVCGNTSDFSNGTSYPQPMANDLHGVESRLTHLTSFEQFVSRFTEQIASADADMTPIHVGNRVSHDVLEVDPASGTREAAGTAACGDRVLAASSNLGAIGVHLGLEPVGCCERTCGAAIKPSREELFASLEVYAALRGFRCLYVCVPAAIEASRHHNRG
jgi:hypothetical protein